MRQYTSYTNFQVCVAGGARLAADSSGQRASTTPTGLAFSPTCTQGLPTLKNEVLKHTLPLCLSLTSEAQYACLKSKVQALDALVTSASSTLPAKTSYDAAKACGIAAGVTC